MVTQVEIARLVNLDVSSVNKILNRVRGPVFRKDTVKRVFKVARDLGYNFERSGKGALRGILEELFPNEELTVNLSILRGVPKERVEQIRKMLYGK